MASRNYVFTINNPLNPLEFVDPRVRYASWQLEVAPTTNTPHYQGYIEFTCPMRVSAVLLVLPHGTHVERRMGTRMQAREYTRKLESRAPGELSGPWEHGVWEAGGAGTRNDLHDLKRRIDDGASELEIADEMFGTWSRNFKAIERYDYLKYYYFE